MAGVGDGFGVTVETTGCALAIVGAGVLGGVELTAEVQAVTSNIPISKKLIRRCIEPPITKLNRYDE